PQRLPDLAEPRHHRTLCLAVARRPVRTPQAARRQYRDVFADDADRSVIARLLGIHRGARAQHLCNERRVVAGVDARRRDLASGGAVSAEDRTWYTKADKVGIRQVFMPDVLPATLIATFVACCSCCIYGTVGAWLPFYLSTEKHWSTAEYSTFYVFWGLVGF